MAFNWDKEEKPEGKWGGNFRFVWVMYKGTMGFLIYLSGDTGAVSDGKVDVQFNGVAYYIKTSGIDTWKADKKLNLQTTKTKLTSGELANKFPVLGDTLLKTTKNGVDGYLDFLDSTKTKVKPLEGGKKAHRYARWTLKDGTTDPLDPWKSNNFQAWWDYLFDCTKLNLPNVVSGVNGKWELETISG